MLEIALSVALGLALAANCGLRAFMPLFIAGLLGRLFEDTIDLSIDLGTLKTEKRRIRAFKWFKLRQKIPQRGQSTPKSNRNHEKRSPEINGDNYI